MNWVGYALVIVSLVTCLHPWSAIGSGALAGDIASSDVIDHRFSFFKADFEYMLSDQSGSKATIGLNEPCDKTMQLCIFFVDVRKALTSSALRRYQRTFETSYHNMLAVGPNTIIIDSGFAEMLLYCLHVDGEAYTHFLFDVYHEREQSINSHSARRYHQSSSDVLSKSQHDKILNDLENYHTFSIFRKLQEIEYRLVFDLIIDPVDDIETLAAKRRTDGNLAPLAAVFLWPLAHESEHINQFRNATILERLSRVLFSSGGDRTAEESADLHAEVAVRAYLQRIKLSQSSENHSALWGLDTSLVSPLQFGELAVASSLSTWRIIGLRQALHHIRGLPFRDLLFELERRPCEAYTNHIRTSGQSIPDRRRSLYETNLDDLIRARIRPDFLITEQEEKVLRARVQDDFVPLSHPFNYSRVEALLEGFSNSEHGAASFSASKAQLEKGLLARLFSDSQPTEPDSNFLPSHVRLSEIEAKLALFPQLSISTRVAGHCVSASCKIIEVRQQNERFAVIEAAMDTKGTLVYLNYHQRFFAALSKNPGEYRSSTEYFLLEELLDALIPQRSNIVVNATAGEFVPRAQRLYSEHETHYEAKAVIEEVVAQSRLCEWGNVSFAMQTPNGRDSHLLLTSSIDSPFFGVRFTTPVQALDARTSSGSR
ncbi:hypothetical protein AS156_36400 [Bradyrhizobium macuxiense]|uniref:Uncharacterized protein n=1 Tax=Bradyrhizobium macuxiense TaxID=1755647 RepID=A0A109K092_9BRAD|nr:hypothetical protein [Bradyrhizobium macuxiense]KWV58275.1 hypothetical protein AS156_36400 [Bradyrhizobium macuxiense]